MTLTDHDPQALQTLAALGGPEMVVRVLSSLRDTLEAQPALLHVALASRNRDQFIRAAHSFLSVSGYAGETALRETALILERTARAEAWAELPMQMASFEAAAARARPRLDAAIAQWARTAT